MARAIRYALAQWPALVRCLEDGRLAIDNNAAENALRPIAVGRKNYLFVGNERGGHTACVLMSPVRTAIAAGVDPREYLRDVMLRMAATPQEKRRELALELVPAAWKQRYQPDVRAHQQSILERLVQSLKG